ncbi:hypothetical protein [Streptomyces coelicoflavus]|uniref:hypothetical protein n=1 Tax=Streptomyces coelicoflavus TaxID=285562 RepID=UPI002E26223C
MELSGARVLVAGARGGTVSGAVTAEPVDRGGRVALAGHDPGRLSHAARACPGVVTARFHAYDPESCAGAMRTTAAALEGLDAVVIAFGAAAFAAAEDLGDETAEHLRAVNPLVPAALSRAALGILRPGSAAAAPPPTAPLPTRPDGTPVVERRAR